MIAVAVVNLIFDNQNEKSLIILEGFLENAYANGSEASVTDYEVVDTGEECTVKSRPGEMGSTVDCIYELGGESDCSTSTIHALHAFFLYNPFI